MDKAWHLVQQLDLFPLERFKSYTILFQVTGSRC